MYRFHRHPNHFRAQFVVLQEHPQQFPFCPQNQGKTLDNLCDDHLCLKPNTALQLLRPACDKPL